MKENNSMENSAVFHVRTLIWEEVMQKTNPSEESEMRKICGSSLIEKNEELKTELINLVDILEGFQKQNDSIRDTILNRPKLQDPPARVLLRQQLKMIIDGIREEKSIPITSEKEKTILGYVLNDSPDNNESQLPQLTPRMKDVYSFDSNLNGGLNGCKEVFLRPGSSRGRPQTASPRPCSRGSVMSTASAPGMLEAIQECLNIGQIETVKEAVQNALIDEEQQLLDDIDFVQSCLEMENDLILEDRRHTSKAMPSMKDLQEFRNTLQKAWLDQDAQDSISNTFDLKIDRCSISRKLDPLEFDSGSPTSSKVMEPKPPTFSKNCSARSFNNAIAPSSKSKVHRIRGAIQDIRDEQFFT